MSSKSDEIEEIEKIRIEHLKWLIDQNLNYFQSFTTRVLQILGFNGILLTIIWTNFITRTTSTPLTETQTVLIMLYLITIFPLGILAVVVTRPRTGEVHLTPEGNVQDIIKNLDAYLKEKSEKLAGQAKMTLFVYIDFLIQIGIFILIAVTLL